tara:strand:+ start:842 stop:1864 length:1023 start_codon:yes stop_codon:yes gene_type:complete
MPMQQMLLGAGGGPDVGTEAIITSGHSDYTWVSDTTTWVCPAGVTSISVVCIGGGAMYGNYGTPHGGGGAGLGWKNNITVSPGTSYAVQVAAAIQTTNLAQNTNPSHTWFKDAAGNILVEGQSGNAQTGGSWTGDGGGAGGAGGSTSSAWGSYSRGAGGGAGGYGYIDGNGTVQPGNGGAGAGGSQSGSQGVDGSNGQNDGAGGGSSMYYASNHAACTTSGGGGGSHLYGTGGGANPSVEGTGTGNGTGGTVDGQQGGNGQSGRDGDAGQYGEPNNRSQMDPNNNHDFYTNADNAYGGGFGSVAVPAQCSGQNVDSTGGAIRIIWPGNTRTFPSNALPVS